MLFWLATWLLSIRWLFSSYLSMRDRFPHLFYRACWGRHRWIWNSTNFVWCWFDVLFFMIVVLLSCFWIFILVLICMRSFILAFLCIFFGGGRVRWVVSLYCRWVCGFRWFWCWDGVVTIFLLSRTLISDAEYVVDVKICWNNVQLIFSW